jgi:hypothetical protein
MTEKKKKNNIINSIEGKKFFGLPSFTGPVIQPGGPACRKAGGVLAGKFPPTLEGGWRVLRKADNGHGGAFPWGNNAAVMELGVKASRRIGPPGIRPLAECQARLSAVNATATGYGTRQRPGEKVITDEAVGLVTHNLM